VEPIVTVYADLTPAQALALAQFLKRVGLDDYKRLAVDADEAWLMLDAGERLRAAWPPPATRRADRPGFRSSLAADRPAGAPLAPTHACYTPPILASAHRKTRIRGSRSFMPSIQPARCA
jgi:hypothetical protein